MSGLPGRIDALSLPPAPEGEDQHDGEDQHEVQVSHDIEQPYGRRRFPGVAADHLPDLCQGQDLLLAVGRQAKRLREIGPGLVPPHVHSLFPETAGGGIEDPVVPGEIGRTALRAVTVRQFGQGEVARGGNRNRPFRFRSRGPMTRTASMAETTITR